MPIKVSKNFIQNKKDCKMKDAKEFIPDTKKTNPEKPGTQLVPVLEKNISDQVLNRIHSLQQGGNIIIPGNYSAENAIKSAWLIIKNTVDSSKKAALEVCTRDSISNSLLDMVVMGLSPAKKQCYFIVYGNQLTLSVSYMGKVAVTKRLKGIKDIFANCIYEDDTFEYTIDLETGNKKLIKHDQTFKNINNNKLVGAYAIIIRAELPPYVEIMNMDQIHSAWSMRKGNGLTSAHEKFPEEMSKRTVINRACKSFWNTSDDSDLLIGALNRATEIEEMPETSYEEVIDQEIEANANKQLIDFKEKEVTGQPELNNNQNQNTEQLKEEISNDEFWSNVNNVIAKIEGFKTKKEFDDWVNTKGTMTHLAEFSSEEGELIDKAFTKKANELIPVQEKDKRK